MEFKQPGPRFASISHAALSSTMDKYSRIDDLRFTQVDFECVVENKSAFSSHGVRSSFPPVSARFLSGATTFCLDIIHMVTTSVNEALVVSLRPSMLKH